jgi:hypothetical protein
MILDAATGEECGTWGWHGVLLARGAVDAVGVPDARLFYDSEDQDYLIDRCGTASFPLTRCGAKVEMTRRPGGHHPPWHYYYLWHNTLYQGLYRRRHIPTSPRLKRMIAAETDLARSIDGRARCWGYFLLGVVHGCAGMLGRRVEPGNREVTTSRSPS